MARVFVCEGSEWFGALVAAYIEPHDDLQFVGSADERHTALSRLPVARPEVASAVVGVADGYIGTGGGEAEFVAAIRALVG